MSLRDDDLGGGVLLQSWDLGPEDANTSDDFAYFLDLVRLSGGNQVTRVKGALTEDWR